MHTTPKPGNEPDATDMSAEPGIAGGEANSQPVDPGLDAEEEEAVKLGDFA